MSPEPDFLAPRAAARTPFQPLPWIVAGAIVLLALAALLFFTHTKPAAAPNALLPPDPYAVNLVVSQLQMSESTSLSGGKSTYLDGVVRNTGPATVSAATVQVLFANSEALPPQIETVPLTPIRTHEPYVDIEPLAAAPLAPGASCEFRLVFEDIGANWNGQLPELRAVRITAK